MCYVLLQYCSTSRTCVCGTLVVPVVVVARTVVQVHLYYHTHFTGSYFVQRTCLATCAWSNSEIIFSKILLRSTLL